MFERRNIVLFLVLIIATCAFSNVIRAQKLINDFVFRDEHDPNIMTNSHTRKSIFHTTAYACEGQTMNITCPDGYRINIIRANYGRFSLNICNEKEMEWADVQCSNNKSTEVMRER
uniref:Sushi domain-containing protein n=1 Tax=Romanomermis culicivorax TaxID=13658 RepID=A0A915JDA0_ROMCU